MMREVKVDDATLAYVVMAEAGEAVNRRGMQLGFGSLRAQNSYFELYLCL